MSMTEARPDEEELAETPPTSMRAKVLPFLTGEWIISLTSASQRRVLHYWLTILWFTAGLVLWIVLRHALWFVGFMSLYAIWITHLAGWAAETPVEEEDDPAE
ncbi:MAG TPA: hypothetical protein VFK76_09770 [Gaiellaceae bacterium]|nr:hypothetical protein [Gaiellaceae bacterium]